MSVSQHGKSLQTSTFEIGKGRNVAQTNTTSRAHGPALNYIYL
jgi:hypothetical protein